MVIEQKTQITKIINQGTVITTNFTKIKRIIRVYYEQLYAKKLNDLDKTGEFPEFYKIWKGTQEEIDNLNRPLASEEILWVIRKLPSKKNPGQDRFTGKLYQTIEEELILAPHEHFQKTEEEGTLPNLFYEANITIVPKLTKTSHEKKKPTDQYLLWI